MIEEIKNQIYELYDSLMEKPNEILQIFQEFFGEDNVDMQGFVSKEVFYETLNITNISTFISIDSFIYYTEYTTLSEEDKSIISTLWTDENAGLECVTSDRVLMQYFLPIMKNQIGIKLFKDLFILLYFPTVRVTNEYDKFVDITDLWVKVPFDYLGKGKGYFGMNRSSYSVEQFKSGYLHSHMSGIPLSDFSFFKTPCTGNGPINSTLSTLAIAYDEAMWQLLCLELDRYIRVESIEGVPYKKLENIKSKNQLITIDKFSLSNLKTYKSNWRSYIRIVFTDNKFKEFLKYLIETNKLKFNYINASYGLGMSFSDTVVTISNEFINWYNEEYSKGNITQDYNYLHSHNIIDECIITDNKLYIIAPIANSTSSNYTQYIGAYICNFKGRDITLNIVETTIEDSSNKVRILNFDIIESIVTNILRIINYNYGREESSETNSGTNTQTGYI